MMRCYTHFRGGVNVPTGTKWGYLYAERSSKELVQPGFPLNHRNDLWDGENSRYAKRIGRYCSTNFGEFRSEWLSTRSDLWSGREPNWHNLVTEKIMEQRLEAEADQADFQTPR